jgi:hypothetical protein
LHFDAGTRRGLRDSLAGKLVLLAAVLLLAYLVARTCGSSAPEVSQEEAIEIAKGEVDFEPNHVQIRNVPRGIEGQRSWMVSLYTGTPTDPQVCRIVEIEANSGDVVTSADC